jgi:type VI secretion system protein ImpG
LSGSVLTLSFVDPDFDPATPAARTLVARLECTNRGLAQALPAGTVLCMEDAGALGAIELLHKPSAQSQAAPDGAARWKLVAQLSLNHLSLVDGATALASLKELLALNNLAGSVIAGAQIDALAAIACERVTRYVGDDPWQGYRRGYRVTLTLAPRPLRGASMLLFGAVLHRFLALYAGINTFVELRLVHDDGRELFCWAPQPSLQVGL